MVRLDTPSPPWMAAFLTVIMVTSVAASTVTSTTSSSSSCSLDCPSDAPCQVGAPDFSNHNIQLDGGTHGMHCACPYGWTGVTCDHKYETCDNTQKCYHGGECIPGMIDKFGNDQLFCDCTKAVASDGTQYVGKYCETPFEKQCNDSGMFCLNGGDCNPDYPNDDASPCLCPDGWEGFHCEFKTGTVPDCTLDCQNDGVCVVGVTSAAEMDHMKHIWSKEEIDSHQRCLCLDGFDGPLCEASSEDCGGNACYHGGTCVETVTTDEDLGITKKSFHCDCTTAADDEHNLYAGKYCQHVSTSFCSDVDENLFCTNDSTCKDDPLQGCDCNAGWVGFKCEFPDTSFQDDDDDDDDAVDDDDDDVYASELCGDKYCFNNGKCVTTTVQEQDGTISQQQQCDCSQTFDGENFFAGSSCQYKSSQICNQEDGTFCVHSGICSFDGCQCKSGWKGDFCEIHDLQDTQPEDPQCGGNVCRNGGKCIETKIIKSPSVEETIFTCDCSTARSDDGSIFYAGNSCQFPSTEVCRQAENEDTNPLFCTNSGRCQENPELGCKCPAGFSGQSCEAEELKEDPTDRNNDTTNDFEECGDLVCHNGGVCVTSLLFNEDGSTNEIKHCNCQTAVTEETAWAGDSCQFEATSFCSKPLEGSGLESTFFCVNNGECQDHVREGCRCPTGWKGFRCEFPVTKEDVAEDEDSTVTECGDLKCYNGATCEVIEETNQNTGDVSKLYACDCAAASSSDGEDNVFFAGPQCQYRSTSLCSSENPSGAFCVNHGKCKENPLEGCDCPPGFSGPLCDILVKGDEHSDKGESCGEGFCYNGGQCVTTKIIKDDDSTETNYHCDCSLAFDDESVYSGISCEHRQSSFCSRSTQGESLFGVTVCSNGGICSDQPNQPCKCQDGWTGPSCSFQINDDDDDISTDEDIELCGDLVCLNNGKCVTTAITDSDGREKVTKRCDCSTAFTDTDVFSGDQCQFKQTVFCSKPADGMDLSTSSWCANGGTCKDNILSGCDCPDAFTGFKCDYQKDANDLINKADDPKLTDDYVECGDGYCYHGGTCNSYVLDNGETEHKCDCSTAATETELYSGRYCQYKMTSLCKKTSLDSLTGADFCTNNGKCPEGEDDDGCICPSGYKGYRCDEPIYAYHDNEDNVAPDLDDDDFEGDDDDDDDAIYECKLQCQNGGQCAKGAKDLSQFHNQVGNVAHLNKTYDHAYFEHCICKEGWFGLECEHQAEICGQNEHLCLHGSTCVRNGDEHSCDCSKTTEQIGDSDHSVFAGDSCQHPATDICIFGDDYPGRPLYYCTNQGSCRDYVSQSDPDPGCDCLDNWTGPHCEISIDAQTLYDNSSRGTGNETILYVSGSVFIALILAFSFAYIYKRRSDDPSTSCMPLRRRRNAGYDPDSSFNLAPKRQSTLSADDNPPPSRPFFRSGSDPMTAFVLPPDSEPQLFQDEPSKPQFHDAPYRDEPDFEPSAPENVPEEPVLVNVGPATDEDGHQLHNVDFL